LNLKSHTRKISDKSVRDLWPLGGLYHFADHSFDKINSWNERDLKRHYKNDALYDNLLLNKFEFAHGYNKLESFPWRLSIPFTRCNAKCEFCSAWMGKPAIFSAAQMELLVPIIKHCVQIDLCGWGEPLMNPDISAILDILRVYR
jgi:hypothetical protein